MTPDGAGEGARVGTVVAAVGFTLVVQSITSMAIISPAVIAPVAADAFGVRPQSIGIFVAAAYCGAMISGLAAGALIARFGASAVSLLAVGCAAAGLMLGETGVLALVPVCAALIGGGHGLVNPASSDILSRAAAPGRMALIFSIKQTGVPIGGALAGALVPSLLLALGWQQALLALGAGSLVLAALLSRVYRSPRASRAVRHFSLVDALRGLGAPIRLALSEPALRELSLVSFAYATMQLTLFTYFVSYLNLELGYTLVLAGLAFSCAQAAGIVGRIVWGFAADRLLGSRAMLAVLGFVMAASGFAAALFTHDWPLVALLAVAIPLGASAIGWNGVYLAEVARRAPAGQVGMATGGTQFFTFFGAVSGPPIFGIIASTTGGYGSGFAVFSVLPLIVGVRLALRRPA